MKGTRAASEPPQEQQGQDKNRSEAYELKHLLSELKTAQVGQVKHEVKRRKGEPGNKSRSNN